MDGQVNNSKLVTDLLGSSDDIKSCCANFYENDIIQLLLGSSLHPGGLDLTKELGQRLNLKPGDKVLDLGTGLGTSALHLAKEFGPEIVGLDLSEKNTAIANSKAEKQELDHLCRFLAADAEKIPFEDGTFDAVISECSFCLFPDKFTAAREIYRVLKSGGRLGITDVAVEKKEQLPVDIQQMIFRVACIADALPIKGYVQIFEEAGFSNIVTDNMQATVYELIGDIKKKIFLAEIAQKLKKINLGSIDLKQAKYWLKKGKEMVDEGFGTYIMLTGLKT